MDDDGGFFNMFGDDDDGEEEHPKATIAVEAPKEPLKLKHDGCPLDDPRNAKVRVMYEGELFPATVKSYQSESDTYTIMWSSSGVLQYRTKPTDINWDSFIEAVEIKKEAKVEEDELWLAARRGSLKSVKRFVESGVAVNETGKSQQRTPFYHAVFCGHLAVVEYLIDLGARDTDDTAFITANAEMRELLLRTGAGGKPRRASIRKSIGVKPVDAEVQTELRRKSVSNAATASIHALEGQVSPAQLQALKHLEERLLAVEAAMKTETRRQSVALKKAASQAKIVKPDDAASSNQPATKNETGKKKVTFEAEKGAGANSSSQAIVPAKTRKPGVFFRVLTALLPRRLFGLKRQ
jgi:hypothetical protein